MYFKPFPKILGKRLNYLLVDKYAKNFNSIIMNECFLLIKRISDINFKFVINCKEKSKVVFKAKLLNNSEIEMFAYDNIADYIYQKNLEIFFLRGKLRENMQVEIIEIYNFKFLD